MACLECDCAERRGRRRVRRLDGREHPGREPRHRRLGPFARLRRGRDACAGRGLGGARHVAQPAGVALCDRVCGAAHVRSADVARWLAAGRADRACDPVGARAVVRSALPRLSVCADDRRARAVCPDRAHAVKDARKRADDGAARGRPETAGRDGGRRCARAQRGLHRLERDIRQLAGAVVCGNARSPRLQPPADAGRARRRISTATASDDSATL